MKYSKCMPLCGLQKFVVTAIVILVSIVCFPMFWLCTWIRFEAGAEFFSMIGLVTAFWGLDDDDTGNMFGIM